MDESTLITFFAFVLDPIGTVFLCLLLVASGDRLRVDVLVLAFGVGATLGTVVELAHVGLLLLGGATCLLRFLLRHFLINN